MKTTWQEWQKHRRGLLGRQLDVASRYDEQAADARVAGGDPVAWIHATALRTSEVPWRRAA